MYKRQITAVVEGTAFGGNVLFHYTLKDIILYVFHVLYFILCTYLTGTTLGKRAMNLRVVSADWGQRLSLLDVVYRETVGRFLCSLSIGIGYIIVGFDGEKRGIHDMPVSYTHLLRKQLPGAVFAAIGWMIVSWIFSVYVDIFKGFSDMYGSLTTIVLIMLWMYFCMYCILLGGELNMMMYDKMFTGKGREKL